MMEKEEIAKQDKLVEILNKASEHLVPDLMQRALHSVSFWDFVHICKYAKESGEFPELYVAMNDRKDSTETAMQRTLVLCDKRPRYVSSSILGETGFRSDREHELVIGHCVPVSNPCTDSRGIEGAELVDARDYCGNKEIEFPNAPTSLLYKI